MATPTHHDDKPGASTGSSTYDARREGTVHTDSVASRTREEDRIKRDSTANTRTTRDAGSTSNVHSATTHPRHTTGTTTTADSARRSAAKKGLWIGVLTFVALALLDWIAGPAFSAFESLTFGETFVYAIVGVIVGVIVKQIDLRRHTSDNHAARRV
jgi:hypothetical protein